MSHVHHTRLPTLTTTHALAYAQHIERRFNSKMLSSNNEMNIKQKLIAIATALRGIRSRTYYRFSCFRGYCPTSDEIENNEIKSLASRLKAGSHKETLTNILEWQEGNIEFWTERHPMLTLFLYIWLIFAVIGPLFYAVFVYSLFLLIVLNSQIVVLVWFIQIAVWFIQNIWWLFAIFAGSALTILVTMIFILHSNRKFPWKKIPRCLKNIVKPSISMNFLLENKLGVCRDYAKLTACLLSNIYPNAEIFFAHAPDHIATGINVDNRLYMVDQRLPILTKDKWNNYRKPRKSDRIEKFDPIKKTLQKDKRTFLQARDTSELNTEKLAERMTELLNIKEQQDDKTNLLQKSIPWKNGAILYEENEMVDYSLARWLETKISRELIRINQITRIKISRQKDDLTFLIRFSQNK